MKTSPSRQSGGIPRRQRPVLVAAVVCGAILGAVPLLFLFYSAVGAVLLGAAILGILIAAQGFVFWPIWRYLRSWGGRCVDSRVKDAE